MKVVLIGAGNVATSLAVELHKHSYDIVQVYSRTEQAAATLARKFGASFTTNIKTLATDADLYIYAVKDSVLEQLINETPNNKGLNIHTAGSMPLSILTEKRRGGVLYPFQTFSMGRVTDWQQTPVFIEASHGDDLKLLQKIGNTISDTVQELTSEQRKYLHLTGVFACNFTNHMYAVSEQILAHIGLPLAVAFPLIKETNAKIDQLSPLDAQTGPAVRLDENVMNKHIDLIQDTKLKEIYRLLSEHIYQLNKNNK